MQLELGPKDHIRRVREKARWARKQEEGARERLAQAERTREFWDALEKHLSAEHSAQVLLVLRQASGDLRNLKVSGDPDWDVLEDIRLSNEKRALEAAATFEREFPEAVRKAGIEIDSTSRHPKYTFNQGFLRIEVNERDLTARLTPRDGREVLIGMDIGPLVQKLRAEIARIFERRLDSAVLLRRIYTAYLAVLRAEGRREGDEVPLRRLAQRLAKNLNNFAADEFNVDLARLVKSGEVATDNMQMHLSHTRNLRQGMLLHGLEEGGYVGSVSFRKGGPS